jgi:hypothetical protein
MARPKCYGTAAQKQKAYRERKKNLTINIPQSDSDNGLPSQITTTPVSQHTVQSLRDLIKAEEEKPAMEAPVRLRVYRSETGAIITKEQWEAREEEKRLAREKGFEIDEYSQA